MSPTIVQELEVPTLQAKPNHSAPTLGERLDLVEHMNVRVQVVLGTGELSIGELFSMTPGSIVSLDREVDAPVDLRINGKLIARGTLVAAGDRFGVRITEVLQGA
jgi:flagellar motor switch protein FliN